MKNLKKNKKLTLALVLVTSITLVGTISAFAHQNFGHGPYGGNFNQGCYQNNLDEKTIEARNKLINETTEIRKQLTIKQSELRALMRSDNPDSKEAGRIAGEVFDLKEQLRAKAEKSDIGGIGPMGMGLSRQFDNRNVERGYGPWSND